MSERDDAKTNPYARPSAYPALPQGGRMLIAGGRYPSRGQAPQTRGASRLGDSSILTGSAVPIGPAARAAPEPAPAPAPPPQAEAWTVSPLMVEAPRQRPAPRRSRIGDWAPKAVAVAVALAGLAALVLMTRPGPKAELAPAAAPPATPMTPVTAPPPAALEAAPSPTPSASPPRPGPARPSVARAQPARPPQLRPQLRAEPAPAPTQSAPVAAPEPTPEPTPAAPSAATAAAAPDPRPAPRPAAPPPSDPNAPIGTQR